jgi:hypothetical protein
MADFKKGQYTVQEYDDAIKREQAWLRKCEEEGSPAAQHFRDNIAYLKRSRTREASGK